MVFEAPRSFVQPHNNPISAQSIEMAQSGNTDMEDLAHENQALKAQLEAWKVDYSALNVEVEGLRRRSELQRRMSDAQEGLR